MYVIDGIRFMTHVGGSDDAEKCGCVKVGWGFICSPALLLGTRLQAFGWRLLRMREKIVVNGFMAADERDKRRSNGHATIDHKFGSN